MSISLSSLVNPNQITSGTSQSLSGTAVGFTGIPSTVKQIQLVLRNVSLTGTDDVYIRIGSGSYSTTGYTSNTVTTSYNTSGGATAIAAVSTAVAFNFPSGNAANVWSAIVNIVNITGNIWVCSSTASGVLTTTVFSWVLNGNISLAGVLDRIQITVSGSNTFDNGTANIIYQ